MKYYVTSDVHGFYTLLRAALTEAGYYDDRLEQVSGAIELDSGAIEEYDDIMVRQLISNIKVMDKETILVRFKDSTEIQQRIERTKGARVS